MSHLCRTQVRANPAIHDQFSVPAYISYYPFHKYKFLGNIHYCSISPVHLRKINLNMQNASAFSSSAHWKHISYISFSLLSVTFYMQDVSVALNVKQFLLFQRAQHYFGVFFSTYSTWSIVTATYLTWCTILLSFNCDSSVPSSLTKLQVFLCVINCYRR